MFKRTFILDDNICLCAENGLEGGCGERVFCLARGPGPNRRLDFRDLRVGHVTKELEEVRERDGVVRARPIEGEVCPASCHYSARLVPISVGIAMRRRES